MPKQLEDNETIKRKLRKSISGEHVDEEIDANEDLCFKDDNFLKYLFKFLQMSSADINHYSTEIVAGIESYLVRHEFKGIIREMVSKGLTFATLNSAGVTALHEAAQFSSAEFFAFLSGLSVNFNVTCASGGNVLFYALRSGNGNVSNFLIGLGFKPQASNAMVFRELKRMMIENKLQEFEAMLRTGFTDIKEYRDIDGSNLALLVL